MGLQPKISKISSILRSWRSHWTKRMFLERMLWPFQFLVHQWRSFGHYRRFCQVRALHFISSCQSLLLSHLLFHHWDRLLNYCTCIRKNAISDHLRTKHKYLSFTLSHINNAQARSFKVLYCRFLKNTGQTPQSVSILMSPSLLVYITNT